MTLRAPTLSESRCRGSMALPKSPARRNMPPNSTCLVSLHGFVVSSTDRQRSYQEHRSDRRARGAWRDRGRSLTTIGQMWPPDLRSIRTRLPRQARHSGRFTTTRSSFPDSLSLWWSRRSSRSRALRPRSSISSMRRKRRSPISTRNSTKPSRRRRSGCLDGTPTLAAMPTRLCRKRRSASSTSIAPRSSTTTRWRISGARRYGTMGRLTVYDKTQGAPNCHKYLCNVFGLAKDKVRVLSPYVGGAFGVGPQAELSAVHGGACRNWPEAFGQGGAHAAADVHPRLSSADDPDPEPRGLRRWRPRSFKHDAIANASRFEDYQEPTVPWSGALYHCD